MGYQPKHGAAGGGGGGDDHLPHLQSPRVGVGGSMTTRRANSFKRCPGGEVELQISGSPRSPRTDVGLGSPPSDAAEASPSSSYSSGSAVGVGGGLHHHQQLRFRLFKRPGTGGGAGEVVLGLGIRERRKLGNLLFFAFCGVCLLLGVGKIWAGGRSALPAADDLQEVVSLIIGALLDQASGCTAFNKRSWVAAARVLHLPTLMLFSQQEKLGDLASGLDL